MGKQINAAKRNQAFNTLEYQQTPALDYYNYKKL